VGPRGARKKRRSYRCLIDSTDLSSGTQSTVNRDCGVFPENRTDCSWPFLVAFFDFGEFDSNGEKRGGEQWRRISRLLKRPRNKSVVGPQYTTRTAHHAKDQMRLCRLALLSVSGHLLIPALAFFTQFEADVLHRSRDSNSAKVYMLVPRSTSAGDSCTPRSFYPCDIPFLHNLSYSSANHDDRPKTPTSDCSRGNRHLY